MGITTGVQLTSRTSSKRPYQSNPWYRAGIILVKVLELMHVSERTDSLLSILGCLKDNSARALRSTVCSNIDIRTNDVPRGTEEIFQILPTSLVGQL